MSSENLSEVMKSLYGPTATQMMGGAKKSKTKITKGGATYEETAYPEYITNTDFQLFIKSFYLIKRVCHSYAASIYVIPPTSELKSMISDFESTLKSNKISPGSVEAIQYATMNDLPFKRCIFSVFADADAAHYKLDKEAPYKEFGIVKGYMTTVHAYTNDQASLDIAHKKGHMARRGRACAANIVQASTGAASAIGLVCPNLAGKLDGTAMRVPVPTGSVVDLTLELSKNTTVEEINDALKAAQNETLQYTEDPIVSSDVIGRRCGSLVDGLSTTVLDVDGKQLVKVVSWYDNEMSYTAQMVRTAKYLMK
jgi:hypothetical protein